VEAEPLIKDTTEPIVIHESVPILTWKAAVPVGVGPPEKPEIVTVTETVLLTTTGFGLTDGVGTVRLALFTFRDAGFPVTVL
jgi:hypothetical protein